MSFFIGLLVGSFLYLLFRYVPVFKCLVYCKFKKIKYHWAVRRISLICHFEFVGSYMREKTSDINTDKFSTKMLIKLYKYSTPFGCQSLRVPQWLPSARELLREEIADRQLLDIK